MLTAILIVFFVGGACGVLFTTVLMYSRVPDEAEPEFGLGEEAGRISDLQQELPFFCKHQAD